MHCTIPLTGLVALHSFQASRIDPYWLFIFSLLAPGQVNAVATLSQRLGGDEMTAGSIMNGSQFPSVHTMLWSLFSSWVDWVTQDDACTEGQWSGTINTSLVAMVSCSLEQWTEGCLNCNSSPENIIAITLMAMLFLGDASIQGSGMARQLLSGCAANHQEVYDDVKSHFHELRVANGVEEPSSPQSLILAEIAYLQGIFRTFCPHEIVLNNSIPMVLIALYMV